ncbi:MAG: SgcJ/EcaC family oxidoreductase [Saprospiraceae bacterium]|nr:SgcJ/EcaC family oxidoreductase [Saprospiraceae bacterium]
MKKINLILFTTLLFTGLLHSQDKQIDVALKALVDTYVKARESKDTNILASILTTDIDQLVSSGKWRKGKTVAMQGMLKSSSSNPGKRTIIVEQTRMLTEESALADAKYQIQNEEGSARNMWSTFVCVIQDGEWKITAIRNMLIPPQ